MSTKKVGILGGGFGLYGYMPAALQSNHSTLVLSKYKEMITVHPVLKNFIHQLQFIDSELELLNASDLLVFARTPEMQFDFIRNLSDLSKVYLFEKPLAQDIHSHKMALNHLEKFKFKYSVNYAFMRTDWYKKLIWLSSTNSLKILINWEIRKPLVQWKVESNRGGGLFHYYGIHFAPMFKQLSVPIESLSVFMKSSSIEIYTDKNCQNNIGLRLKFSNKSQFHVRVLERSSNKILYTENFSSPFGVEITKNDLDPRVSGISQYFTETLNHDFFVNASSFEYYVLEFRGIDGDRSV